MAATKISETTFHIGGHSATLAAESTWTQVEGFRLWNGDLDGTWATADTSTMANVVNQSTKTTFDAGEITVVVIEDEDDAGLTALKAAEADSDDNKYNFKFTDPKGKIYRFKAIVKKGSIGSGNRGAIYERSFILDRQTRTEEVAAP